MSTIIKSALAITLGFLFGANHLVSAPTNDLSATLSKGLFEEEANHNLGAAIQMYQSVIERFDTERKVAATAVFRLGECYRKQGNTNQANAQYRRILREFVDQAPLVTMSRQYLSEASETASINATGKNAAESLGSGGDLGEISKVRAIIQSSPDLINAPDQSGQTLLQTYAGRGDLAVVKLLLDNGAIASGIKQPELTPLHFAAGNGHKAIVDLLLSKGAKPDAKTESGVTPLHIAVRKGYEMVARALLDAGASANSAVTQDVSHENPSYAVRAGQTPLHLACLNGFHSLVDLLLAKGANPNAAPDDQGQTPLSLAAVQDDGPMVSALLAAHADPNASNSRALIVAAESGNMATLKLLLTHGGKPDVETLKAAVRARKPAAIKELIASKVDPNATDFDWWGLTFAQPAPNDAATIRALLDGGADPNRRNSNGESALERVISAADLIQIFIDHGADVNSPNPYQVYTPLHYAAMYGCVASAKLLLARGAKVDSRAKDGATPLHLALSSQHEEVAAFLLENGADPNALDNSGRAPLDIVNSVRQTPALALPSGVPRLPGQPTPSSNLPLEVLLRQHGATDDLPHMDSIILRRSVDRIVKIFSRSNDNTNRFSLLELIGVHYGFISAANNSIQTPSGYYSGTTHVLRDTFAFPDLGKIEIRRPKLDGKGWTSLPAPVQAILESGDCSGDPWLQWGDQVEIPEADHSIDQSWPGFSQSVIASIEKCLSRNIQVTVKGETTTVPLVASLPRGQGRPDVQYRPPSDFFIAPALQRSGLLRTSSDLSRVKITRHNAATLENWERTFDCSGKVPYPDLWLRDGDKIEVPDKP
jgi:ankyrin repeat protein